MKRWWDILNWRNCGTPSEREEGGGSGRSYALPVILLNRLLLLLPISVPCCGGEQCGAQMSVGRKGRVAEIRQGAGRSRSPGGVEVIYRFRLFLLLLLTF